MLFAAFIIFLLAVGVLMVLVYASSPQTVDIGRRLSRALRPAGAADEKDASGIGRTPRRKRFCRHWKNAARTPKGKKASQDQILLTRAGYRSENAASGDRRARDYFFAYCCLSSLTFWTGLSSDQSYRYFNDDGLPGLDDS